MMSYNEAKEIFETARDKDAGKPIGNNTRLVKVGDSYGIKLHRTIVVMINRDGSYTLNSGGWDTRTTFDRINHYGPVKCYSTKRVRHVYRWDASAETMVKVCQYQDGITLDSDGRPVAGFLNNAA